MTHPLCRFNANLGSGSADCYLHRCTVGVGDHEVDAERHHNIHVTLDTVDLHHLTSGDVVDPAIGLRCRAVETHHALEAGDGQRFVNIDS